MIIMAWDYHREGNILISLTLLKKKKSINSNTLILLLFASFLTQLSFIASTSDYYPYYSDHV